AHLLEWGMRCIITQVFTPAVPLAYQWQLSRTAGGHGGTRTAYFYDIAMRQKAARALEQGAGGVDALLCTLDWDLLKAAKAMA
ncbi:unnamed protein product, partial [Prorocentrum cordatum]